MKDVNPHVQPEGCSLQSGPMKEEDKLILQKGERKELIISPKANNQPTLPSNPSPASVPKNESPVVVALSQDNNEVKDRHEDDKSLITNQSKDSIVNQENQQQDVSGDNSNNEFKENDSDIFPNIDENDELIKKFDYPNNSSSSTHEHVHLTTYNVYNEQEDDVNTIQSGETTKFQLPHEENRMIPPPFIRYRFAIELDTADPFAPSATKEQSPEERYKNIFVQLCNYIKSIDSEAMLVSWKNDPSFQVYAVKDEFPQELQQIALYFNGFRAKLKVNYRNSFRVCIHSPKWHDTWLEIKLVAWANARSYSLSKCNIQAEESTVIGWLVYSFSFTNVTTLKSLLMKQSKFEWGFKLGSPTTSDKHLEWKHRMKALEVMVPSDKEESARQLVSSLFSPYKKSNKIKGIFDCYLFVGRENEHKTDDLAMIYAELLGRHKFRYTNIEIEQVTCIVKDIDKVVKTKNNTKMSIREMILNLPLRQHKYAPGKLFLSVDFVAKGSSTWFRNVCGRGGACYYLTFYSWDAGEAMETVKGLGRFLQHYHGKDCVQPFFSQDHWDVTENWICNPKRKNFDTPEQQHIAANILFDPTSNIIQAYNEQKEIEDKELQQEAKKKKSATKSKKKEDNVNQLADRDTELDNNIPVISNEEAKKISENAKAIASQLHVSAAHLKQQREKQTYAMTLAAKEADPDLDSLPEIGKKKSEIHSVSKDDQASVSSSVTDMTDNTINKKYHNEDVNYNSDASSFVSDSSIQSIKETDVQDMLNAGMSRAEVQKNLSITAAHIKNKASQKADRLLAISLKLNRLQGGSGSAVQEETTSTPSSNQSGSNCDATRES